MLGKEDTGLRVGLQEEGQHREIAGPSGLMHDGTSAVLSDRETREQWHSRAGATAVNSSYPPPV